MEVKLQYAEHITSSIALMKINALSPIDMHKSFHHQFEVITLTINSDDGESYQESINQSFFSRMYHLNTHYYAPLAKSIKNISNNSQVSYIYYYAHVTTSMMMTMLIIMIKFEY